MTQTQPQTRTPAPDTVRILPFAPDHLPEAQALSQSEGWPHRLQDWALGLSVSQGVVALAGGRVVATALCAFHGPVATLNMIIVDPTMRGRGLGRQMMARIIDLAGPRQMRLVATDDGLPLYLKMGFRPAGRIVQLTGLPRATRPERPVQMGPVAAERLAAMDSAASGMARGPLLARIAAMGETLATQDGFALLRPFGRGHVLGPVVARDDGAARALIAAGATHMAGRYLRIDVPQERGLVPFVQSLGLATVGGGLAMVRGPEPPHPETPHPEPHALYTHALISQALG